MNHAPIPSPDDEITRLPNGARDLRRFDRQRISARGTTRFGGRSYALTLDNLSEQGCQFRIPRGTGLPTGTTLSLTIDTLGPFKATVRWSREGEVGVEFDFPVYPPVLQHMLEKLCAAQ